MIFANNIINESSAINEEFDMDEIEVCATDDYVVEAVKHELENEQNYNTLMQAVALNELAYYSETGEELEYFSEAEKGTFIEKVKQFFRRMWEKIKSLGKTFMLHIDKITKSNSGFVKKYKTEIEKGDVAKCEHKGFKFTDVELHISNADGAVHAVSGEDLSSIKSMTKEAANSFLEKHKDLTECEKKLRGKILGKNDALDAKQFRDELFKALRDGKSEKEKLDGNAMSNKQVVDLLLDGGSAKSNVKAAAKRLDATMGNLIKQLDKTAKDMAKEKDAVSERVRVLSIVIRLCKSYTTSAEVAYGAMMAASRDAMNQAKSLAVKLVAQSRKAESEKKKDKDMHESGILAGVTFR